MGEFGDRGYALHSPQALSLADPRWRVATRPPPCGSSPHPPSPTWTLVRPGRPHPAGAFPSRRGSSRGRPCPCGSWRTRGLPRLGQRLRQWCEGRPVATVSHVIQACLSPTWEFKGHRVLAAGWGNAGFIRRTIALSVVRLSICESQWGCAASKVRDCHKISAACH
jgi:hypothetical protein